ncbi:hypothetical protein CDAR_306511 [Caerostris darwini]|uniref:Uncharacterized protein n=1 Tax=Caerostris darwini TaxID=1538125 RepID=A0AAV4STE8_9ARAC|nr:hypothetical protein CDAR_306511 [Caerostris darwini]
MHHFLPDLEFTTSLEIITTITLHFSSLISKLPFKQLSPHNIPLKLALHLPVKLTYHHQHPFLPVDLEVTILIENITTITLHYSSLIWKLPLTTIIATQHTFGLHLPTKLTHHHQHHLLPADLEFTTTLEITTTISGKITITTF